MPSVAALWWPIASPVVSRPKTRKGCARAWYATSFAMGSGMKYLICANTCGRATQVRVGVRDGVSDEEIDLRKHLQRARSPPHRPAVLLYILCACAVHALYLTRGAAAMCAAWPRRAGSSLS